MVAAILNSGNKSTSGNVGSVTDVSGLVANVGVAVRIGSRAHFVQQLFPLPVFAGRHLEFWWSDIVHQRQSTSGSIPSEKSKSGAVENMGVEV